MLNENTIEKLTERFGNRFSKYNEDVLKALGETIKKFNGLSYSEAYALGQQLKYNKTLNELLQELSNISGKSIQDIQQLLIDVANKNIEFADVFYKAKGLETPIYSNNFALQNLVKSISNVATTDFINLARTTGFKLLDSNGNPLLLNFQQAYNEVIDRCVYSTLTGKDTFQNSIRNTIKQLSNSGVRKIEYKSGYSKRLDSSVRQNVKDTIKQVTNESQLIFGQEFDSDGVEISVHMNPAPDHALVQGRQFSNEEFKKFQNNMVSKSYDGMIFSPEYNGNDRRSIGEYNCYHSIFSIVLGVSKPEYNASQLQQIIDDNNKGVKIDDKEYSIYEVTQLQRQLETKIRQEKDTQIISRASGDKELASESQSKINDLTYKYNQISKIAKLPTKKDRLLVSGYHRISTKID